MIFKNKLNSSLKVFLLSLAVVDDLLSILMISVLYSSDFNYYALGMTLVIVYFIALLNKLSKKDSLVPYLILGLLLWGSLYLSGIHATISGVILAMMLPTKVKDKSNKHNISEKPKGARWSSIFLVSLMVGIGFYFYKP